MEGHRTGRAGTGCVLSPGHFLPELQLDSKAPPEGGDRTRKPGLCTRFSETLTSLLPGGSPGAECPCGGERAGAGERGGLARSRSPGAVQGVPGDQLG